MKQVAASASGARSVVKSKTTLGHRILRNWQIYIFLLLPLAYLLIFAYYPMTGLQLAFKKFDMKLGIWGSPWVGFDQFTKFFSSPYFKTIIPNTLKISIYSLIAGFPLPIIFALLLNTVRSTRFRKTVQTITYLPYFISVVILVGMMKELMSPVDGIVNKLITAAGGEAINFFSEPGWFRTLYIGSALWQGVGYSAIIYMAALAGIDVEQYEAAQIDGAGRFQKIWYITLPGIMPTAVILLIMQMGSLFSSDFQKILLMYSPSIYSTADVISTYTYRYGLENANYSYGAAIGLMLSVISFVFVWGANAFSRRVSDNSLW